jgi:hypothetical protein
MAPNGIVEKAANAVAAEMIGASVNRKVSAAFGRSSSLKSSLMMSANGWSSPAHPVRVGPTRCCMYAHTLRSTHTMPAAA